MFTTCREAIKTPIPLGPYPSFVQGSGWVRIELSPDQPHPYLRIQNGYDLKLEVPKKPKFFKVSLQRTFRRQEARNGDPKKSDNLHLSSRFVDTHDQFLKQRWS